MPTSHVFVAWEERIISHEKGNRLVHFYLKDFSGDSVLAVVGTERSIRHMIYVLSDEFLQEYGSKGSIHSSRKWRARRDVVDWLTSLVAKHHPPLASSNSQDLVQSLGSHKLSMGGFANVVTHSQDQMIQVPKKLKVRNLDIMWLGDSWICCKQLKHYPAFHRNGTTIAVHSFVFIMAEEENQYLGYLEDMYEDKKEQKKVKVRWFHHGQEVKGVIPHLNPHPAEVFITRHVQVISAECIDGPAAVLTPKHYEKCVAAVPQSMPSGIHVCFRQFKNNKIKPFSLSKLSGYSNQSILSFLDLQFASKDKIKGYGSNGVEEEDFTLKDPVRQDAKRIRSCRMYERLESGNSGFTNLVPGNQLAKCEPTYKKLRIKLSSKRATGIELVDCEPQHQASFKIGEKIELLCQDSGMRGCWFKCKVLQASPKCLQVQYHDVEDADGFGKLEEWVPASRLAAHDKLGIRRSGRLTIRPWPLEFLSDCSLEVGAAVDAWWSDGWWEGVVIGSNPPGSDSVQVYFPGENRFLTIQRKNMRTSRDWINNRWVNIKTKPDILSSISSIVSHNMDLPTRTRLVEAIDCNATLVDCRSLATPRLEAVEDQNGLPGSANGLRYLERLDLSKQLCVDNEDKVDDSGHNVSAENKAKSVLEDDGLEPAN